MHRIGIHVVLLLFAWTASASAENNYNVLFIAVDDLRPELGCYGRSPTVSPALDELAQESVVFRNHFVQVPTCGASRYALLTGRSPGKTGALGNEALYRGKVALSSQQLPGAQSLTEMFRRSGYHTTLIGKISHTADGKVYAYNGQGDGRDEVPHAWDELATPYGPWKRGWGIFFAYANGKHREDGDGHLDLMEFTAEQDNQLPDGMLAETAIEKLQAYGKSGERFFMGLGFFKPHLPFVATRQDWEAVDSMDIQPVPHGTKPETAYWHSSGEFYKYKTEYPKTNPLAKEDQITARKAYLACVRYTDRQIGKVLAGLKESGLEDSTIVVVWGDHGWQLGESALWAKHVSHERALNSPLLIKVPGVTSQGRMTSALAETLDIYPTLVQLCDPKFQQTEYPLDGVSLASILNGTSDKVRDIAVSYWRNNQVSIRDDQHRLIVQMQKGTPHKMELYDVRDTPDPLKNLAKEKPDVVSKLIQSMQDASPK
ncbi:sulfatase [Bremerella alba]|uniref:Choline-sulfatase n=1 Tax=Bremerella alba TaxID=980252 RepID=A0A7V8V1X1_9BACT|nr:sulfatase [Bremerella alba]MBA2113400.1 Choline-sulfatase [Bremerella alba]